MNGLSVQPGDLRRPIRSWLETDLKNSQIKNPGAKSRPKPNRLILFRQIESSWEKYKEVRIKAINLPENALWPVIPMCEAQASAEMLRLCRVVRGLYMEQQPMVVAGEGGHVDMSEGYSLKYLLMATKHRKTEGLVDRLPKNCLDLPFFEAFAPADLTFDERYGFDIKGIALYTGALSVVHFLDQASRRGEAYLPAN